MARWLPTRVTEPGWSRRAVRGWVVQHDNSWLFVLSYVGLAVVLSILISLFWLVAVVGVHVLLERVRQRHYGARGTGLLARVAWELKLDFALILLALLLAAYMDVVLGVAGVGGAARLGAAGLRGGARAAGWSRAAKGILISLDDLAHVLRAALMRRSRRPRPVEVEPQQTPINAAPDDATPAAVPDYRFTPRAWSLGDHLAIWLGVACLLLLVTAPWLTEHTGATLLYTLAAELHPFPHAAK